MDREERTITHFHDGIGVSLRHLTPLTFRHGAFGTIGVFRHPELGRVFILNDEIQHVEAWSPLYHEPLVHLAASFVGEVKDVLILGGGTLYAASEALKYNSVERVVVLDHDPFVTETVAQLYPHAKMCLKDDRFTLVHQDAYSAMSGIRDQFDLVINDGADLLAVKSSRRRIGPGWDAFSAMVRALKPNGVCADVVYRHLFERQRIQRTVERLRECARFALSLVFLPEYHGILHVLCIWGGKASSVTQSLVCPKNKEQLHWMKNPNSSLCTYFDPRFLPYYLYLPRYMKIPLKLKE
jgi:spermidine synthase